MPGRHQRPYIRLMMEQIETVIVGGGQAGLALGYHLGQRGRSFVILDANERTGDSWRKRWDSLQLFTPAYLSDLPGLDFPRAAELVARARTRWPTTSRRTLPDLIFLCEGGCRSTRSPKTRTVSSSAPMIICSSRTMWCCPPAAIRRRTCRTSPTSSTPASCSSTQASTADASQLRDGDVLVVGAANSGAEIALETLSYAPSVALGSASWYRSGARRKPGRQALDPTLLVLYLPGGQRDQPDRTADATAILKMTLPLGRVKPKDLDLAGVVRLPRTIGVQRWHAGR